MVPKGAKLPKPPKMLVPASLVLLKCLLPVVAYIRLWSELTGSSSPDVTSMRAWTYVLLGGIRIL